MRRPDTHIYFWAVPIEIQSRNGELGRIENKSYQDCCNSMLRYTTTKSMYKNVYSIYEANIKKNIKITTDATQLNPYHQVFFHDPCGGAQATFDSEGRLKTIFHRFSLGEEVLKLVVDFDDGNQWYLYQYDDLEEESKVIMLDRGDNISESSAFARLDRLTTLLSHHDPGELGSISLANRTDLCFIELYITNKPGLGIYIPKSIPVVNSKTEEIPYLVQFPRHLFKMVKIDQDNPRNIFHRKK